MTKTTSKSKTRTFHDIAMTRGAKGLLAICMDLGGIDRQIFSEDAIFKSVHPGDSVIHTINEVDTLKELLVNFPQSDINAKNKDGVSPLYCSIGTRNPEKTMFLIEQGAKTDIESLGADPMSILCSSNPISRTGRESTIRCLNAYLDAMDTQTFAELERRSPHLIKTAINSGAFIVAAILQARFGNESGLFRGGTDKFDELAKTVFFVNIDDPEAIDIFCLTSVGKRVFDNQDMEGTRGLSFVDYLIGRCKHRAVEACFRNGIFPKHPEESPYSLAIDDSFGFERTPHTISDAVAGLPSPSEKTVDILRSYDIPLGNGMQKIRSRQITGRIAASLLTIGASPDEHMADGRTLRQKIAENSDKDEFLKAKSELEKNDLTKRTICCRESKKNGNAAI